MKKLLLIGFIVLSSCSDNSVVSIDYYKAHLDEAKAKVLTCSNDKDANVINCDNAKAALSDHALKEQQKKIYDSL